MYQSLKIAILLISSTIGLTFFSNRVDASPSCYGVDEAGNTLDLSQLCSPTSGGNVLPSNSTNNQSAPDRNSEESQVTEEDQKSETSAREEGEKDIQSCFNSPACISIMEGDDTPQKTPHQVRIDQVLNGGAIKQD